MYQTLNPDLFWKAIAAKLLLAHSGGEYLGGARVGSDNEIKYKITSIFINGDSLLILADFP